MGRHRDWSDMQLRRMRQAYEGGQVLTQIASRFGTTPGTVQDLATKHGWERAMTRTTA